VFPLSIAVSSIAAGLACAMTDRVAAVMLMSFEDQGASWKIIQEKEG
jgi:hypothetical protein